MKIKKKFALREFIDTFLIKDSTAESRIKYWTDKGLSIASGYQYITEANKQFGEEYRDVIGGKYTKDKVLQLLEETLERSKGKNDKLYHEILKTIIQTNSIADVLNDHQSFTLKVELMPDRPIISNDPVGPQLI